MIPNPDNTQVQILEPLSKMTKGNKKQYVVDVKVMNYLLQAIPNDIYNSVDASKKAKEIWQRIKRLMFGSDVTSHVRHSRLMDVFDKFAAKEGESLESVYERLTTLVNIMDRNNVHPIPVSISTRDTVSYDVLYYSLVQFKPHVLASKAKKAAKNHDPLALIAHSNASSSQSYANSSYSPQSYYVTHPLSIIDYEDEYQGELQGDSQEDKITTAMMLLAREITQKFSTPTNNGLHTSSKTRNQVVIQDGRVDIQTKNASYGGNNNMNAGRQNRNQAFNAGTRNDERNQIVQRVPRTESTPRKANVQCYNYNEKGHYACDCQKPKVCDAKYFREKMLLAMKDEAGSILKDEENDFLLDNSYEDDTMEELTAAVMADKDTIERILKEKEKNQNDFLKVENEKLIIQHETQLAKKAFKDREDRYLDDIDNLEEKLSSHDRIVYKMGQSIQTIHMIRKKPNKVYDPFLNDGLGYNPKRLKKAIVAQPKVYDGEMLHSATLKIDSPDSEKTLEDSEESRLKMRNKMVQINYAKLNSLYETFVPQQEYSIEQTYFSIPSTSNIGSESKEVTSNSPIPKMPNESKLLKMFDKMGVAINGLRTRIDKTLLEDKQRRWMSDSQNSLR
ncbi:putative reverse transcriptase domain-containing protein [Tanacetum coccineum]